jgi:hypothetical protein
MDTKIMETRTTIDWDDWAIQAAKLLHQSTGAIWGVVYKIDLWDIEFEFRQGDFRYKTRSINIEESNQGNFYILLRELVNVAYLWRKANDPNSL